MSYTKNKLKDLLRPHNIPKPVKSANSSPRNVKSIDFSNSEPGHLTSSTNKSACVIILKNLSELSTYFESITKRSKDFDKDFIDLLRSCEKSLNSAKQKLFELSSEDDNLKFSDSKSFQEISSFFKPEITEYTLFLEQVIAFEQAKTEAVLKKTKFPKSKIAEIEKSLTEEHAIKYPGSYKPVKNNEPGFTLKAKNEISDLVAKIKKKIMKNSKIPEETLEILNESQNFSICRDLKVPSMQKIIDEHKTLLKENRKIKDLYENSLEDNKKLNSKYFYLISRLNKQDETVKKQSRILKSFSQDPEWLREQLNKFKEEINFYISLLRTHIIEHQPGKSNFISLLHQKALLESENQKLQKDLEKLKTSEDFLSKRLKEAVEENLQLKDKEISENSLNLAFSVNDLMEIQKLKEQIRVISFKSSEAQNKLKLELESYKSQVNRLKAEKFSLDERLRSTNKTLAEMEKENQRLVEEVSKIKTFTCSQSPKPLPMLSGDTFNVADPSDSFGRVDPADVFSVANYEIEEIAENLRNHSIFPEVHNNLTALLRKVVSFVIELKENLEDEPKEFWEVIQELVKEHKTRVATTDKAFDLNYGAESFLASKQIEIYKGKLRDKKNLLELYHQQIKFLKKSLKESKEEVSKASPIDFECVRDMFGSIIREVPQLNAKTETLIEVLLKTLSFSADMTSKINNERKSRRNSGLFKGFFN
jgi:hypothetical protein